MDHSQREVSKRWVYSAPHAVVVVIGTHDLRPACWRRVRLAEQPRGGRCRSERELAFDKCRRPVGRDHKPPELVEMLRVGQWEGLVTVVVIGARVGAKPVDVLS